jgi:hypothetical protein
MARKAKEAFELPTFAGNYGEFAEIRCILALGYLQSSNFKKAAE